MLKIYLKKERRNKEKKNILNDKIISIRMIKYQKNIKK